MLGQRAVGIHPAVGQQRRGRAVLQVSHRAQSGMTPEALGARELGRGSLLRVQMQAAMLEELGLCVIGKRNIQPVYPGHGLAGRIVVGVPVPAALGQKVAARHADRVAVDHGPHAFAFDHKAKGMLSVAMLGRIFARHQVLDGSPQRGRGKRAAAQRRIGQRNRAALAAPAHGDDATGFIRQLEQILPAPQMRGGLAFGMGRHQAADFRPQRHQHFLLETSVQLRKRCCGLGLAGGVAGRELDR
ncbi:hypothetical protein SDC9_135959 [bioreactor metagenome]|uniref:Uncharacterized protein n=1 Tax=bioreactor metagenome TaxID=1076179 RepID=A0A645DI12_9ZZZZ